MHDLTITLRDVKQGIVVVYLQGKITGEAAHLLDDNLADLLARKRCKVVFNCQDLTYIHSAGLEVLLKYLIRFRMEDGDFKLCHVDQRAKRAFNLFGLQNLFQFFLNEREAISEFMKHGSGIGVQPGRPAPKETDRQLRIKHRRLTSGASVLYLVGSVDRHTLGILEGALNRLLDDDRSHIAINCQDLRYISSSGMGIFIAYLQKIRARGGDIVFCEMSEMSKTVFTLLGLHHRFKVVETEDEAVRALESMTDE